jgi:hypothetical protein
MDTHHLLEPTEALDAIQQVEGVLAEGGAYLFVGSGCQHPLPHRHLDQSQALAWCPWCLQL